MTSARPSRAKLPTARVTHRLLRSCSIFLCSSAGATSGALPLLLSTIPLHQLPHRGGRRGGASPAPHRPIRPAKPATRVFHRGDVRGPPISHLHAAVARSRNRAIAAGNVLAGAANVTLQ